MLSDTPASRAASWALGHVVRRGAGLTLDDVVSAHESVPEDFDLENYRGDYVWIADQLGDGCTVEAVDVSDPSVVRSIMVSPSGRRWEWNVTVSPDPPHGITDLRLLRALPPGVEIRVARAEDGEALRGVAQSAPVRMAAASVTIDPGDDYFATCRLMGDSAVTYVATYDARPIGVHCGVTYPGALEGIEKRFCLIAHSRLLPDFSGGGIWGRLNETVIDHFRARGGRDVGIAYVRPDNAAAQRLGGAESRWATRPFRAVLDCRASAGAGAGRTATPADAARVVELINLCHAEEELFLAYTPERLVARLTRAPDLYTWDNVLLSERAVVGVWASGQVHTLVPDSGEPVVSRRAAVLDYGFVPGGEEELEGLLRAWCSRLVDAGITHLGVFSSPASRGVAHIRALASGIEEYDLMPPGVPEPATVAAHGIYVDPVYF